MIKRMVAILFAIMVVLSNQVFAYSYDNEFIKNDLTETSIQIHHISTNNINDIAIELMNDEKIKNINLEKISDMNPELLKEIDNIMKNKSLGRDGLKGSIILLDDQDPKLVSLDKVKTQFIPALLLGGLIVSGIYYLVDTTHAEEENYEQNKIGTINVYIINGTAVIGDEIQKTTYKNTMTNITPSLSYQGPNVHLDNNSIDQIEDISPVYNLSDRNITSSINPNIIPC